MRAHVPWAPGPNEFERKSYSIGPWIGGVPEEEEEEGEEDEEEAVNTASMNSGHAHTEYGTEAASPLDSRLKSKSSHFRSSRRRRRHASASRARPKMLPCGSAPSSSPGASSALPSPVTRFSLF